MNKDFKIPPMSVKMLTSPDILIKHLSELIGNPFNLTRKTRTDGSNLRKLIAATLEKHPLPDMALEGQFEIVPPKGKGVPKIRREFIDTYLVTSGYSYNLQVWNRIPASHSLLIKYESGESLKCSDVTFVFIRIFIDSNIIASIVILTPEYIEEKFGKFGKPTIKNKLLISSKARKSIYDIEDKILSFPDTKKLSYYLRDDYTPPTYEWLKSLSLKNYIQFIF